MGPDEARVKSYLKNCALTVERFSKAETRAGKTPDFRVFQNGEFLAYCEVKSSPKDQWLDDKESVVKIIEIYVYRAQPISSLKVGTDPLPLKRDGVSRTLIASLPPIHVHQIADQQCCCNGKHPRREVERRVDVAARLRLAPNIFRSCFHLIHVHASLNINTMLAPTNERDLHVRERRDCSRCDRIHQVGGVTIVRQPACMPYFMSCHERLIGGQCLDDDPVMSRRKTAAVGVCWSYILNDEHNDFGAQPNHPPETICELACSRRKLKI